MEPEKEIRKLRLEIDEIDREVAQLLQKRFQAVRKIGRVKKAAGTAVEDSQREKEVLKNYMGEAAGSMDEEFIKKFTALVLEYSKKIQRDLK